MTTYHHTSRFLRPRPALTRSPRTRHAPLHTPREVELEMIDNSLLPPCIKGDMRQLQMRTEPPALEGDLQPPLRLLRSAIHALRQRRGGMRSTAY
jgi:hypothetical protein